MWLKVTNLENSLFPELRENLRIEEFSSKEFKLIKILDFAEIEKNIITTSRTNTLKSREQIARAFIAKSVYNFQTTSDLKIAEKTHAKFVKEYLCEKIFFYNAIDATKIPLREKAVKKEKVEKVKHKAGQPKKGETREP